MFLEGVPVLWKRWSWHIEMSGKKDSQVFWRIGIFNFSPFNRYLNSTISTYPWLTTLLERACVFTKDKSSFCIKLQLILHLFWPCLCCKIWYVKINPRSTAAENQQTNVLLANQIQHCLNPWCQFCRHEERIKYLCYLTEQGDRAGHSGSAVSGIVPKIHIHSGL